MNVTIGNKIKQLRKSTKSMTQEQVVILHLSHLPMQEWKWRKSFLGKSRGFGILQRNWLKVKV
jgi:hypothetical protein